jgi:hypothetical protein
MRRERDRYLRIRSCNGCFARVGDHCLLAPLVIIPRAVIDGAARYPQDCPAPHLPKKPPASKRPLYEFEG